jgi:hypothetical protein
MGFLATLANALVFGRLKLSIVEVLPEFFIFQAFAKGRLDKETVVAALDFLHGVADGLEEILVGMQDGAVQIEFNNGLDFVDGGKLAAKFHQFGVVIGGAFAVAFETVLAVNASWSGQFRAR